MSEERAKDSEQRRRMRREVKNLRRFAVQIIEAEDDDLLEVADVVFHSVQDIRAVLKRFRERHSA